MEQDEITGIFHFIGKECEDAQKYTWSCLMDLSWYRIIEICLRIIFKKPPNWVEYKNPDYYKKKSFNELEKLAGHLPKEGR